MPEFLKDKPTWVGLSLAALVCACLILGADVLSLLCDYHTGTTTVKLSDSADDAPTTRESNTLRRRIASSHEPIPTLSPSASASPQPLSPSPEALPASNAATPAQSESESSYPAKAQDTSTSSDYSADAKTSPYAGTPTNSEVGLQGIMLGDATGIAVLSYSGTTYTVAPGDKFGPYKVTDIEADRVILDKNGQRSQVSMSVPPSESSVASSAIPKKSVGDYPPVLPPPEAVPLPPQPIALPTSEQTPSSGRVYNITESDLLALPSKDRSASELTREELDEFTRKGAALMADIRGSEVENARGIRLEFRNPDNALAKLGLRDGDIILRINSKSVVGVEDIYNSVLTLRDAPQVDIDILRNGEPMSVFHKFPER